MVRIAHVLGRLDRGGVETWLKDIILHYDKDKYQMEFVLTKSGEGVYDEIVMSEGSRLNTIPLSHGIFNFSWNLYKLFRNEKYDIIHTHLHFFSGYICLIAFFAGVSFRISHSHSDTSILQKKATLFRKFYYEFQRFLLNVFSNRKLACSIEAGKALYKKDNYNVLYCGVDFEKFYYDPNTSNKEKILFELNIPNNAIIIGHVGRFSIPKNHSFIIDIFAEFKGKSDIFLILIGEGTLMDAMKNKAYQNNIENIRFLGGRNDVNIFMRDVFDIFLFPSLYEGLGICLLEAQVAGLKCLISDMIPTEVILINENMKRLSLNDSPKRWKETLLEMLRYKNDSDYNSIIDRVNDTPFNIKNSTFSLENIYNQCINEF